jgi:MerR HTH family regulatory protein
MTSSPTGGEGAAGPDPAVLSISEVSRRTGIPAAGLRNWEQRYGLPRPQSAPAWPPRPRPRSRPGSRPGWARGPRPLPLTCAGPAACWSGPSTTWLPDVRYS